MNLANALRFNFCKISGKSVGASKGELRRLFAQRFQSMISPAIPPSYNVQRFILLSLAIYTQIPILPVFFFRLIVSLSNTAITNQDPSNSWRLSNCHLRTTRQIIIANRLGVKESRLTASAPPGSSFYKGHLSRTSTGTYYQTVGWKTFRVLRELRSGQKDELSMRILGFGSVRRDHAMRGRAANTN